MQLNNVLSEGFKQPDYLSMDCMEGEGSNSVSSLISSESSPLRKFSLSRTCQALVKLHEGINPFSEFFEVNKLKHCAAFGHGFDLATSP